MVIFSGLMGAMVGDEANAETSSGAVDTALVADDNSSSNAGAAADTNGRDLGGDFDF